jgi:predicted metalloprotease
MELGDQRASGNVEDRRGMGPMVGGGLGIGGVVIAIIYALMGGDPGDIINGMQQSAPPPEQAQAQQRKGPPDEMQVFVSKVLGSTEDVWQETFKQMNRPYHDPKLVLFTGSTRSACGVGQAAMGPFYCPNDEKVYIDLSFWNDLKRSGGSTGDFAQAYVVAHELGHHVQKQLGIETRMQRLAQQDPDERNHLSVDLELQADCFAGVWGHSTEQRNIVHPEDVDEALKTAASVGDDHLQKMSGRAVSPERWTHGSSAQRSDWFHRGLQGGTVGGCTTFNGALTP